MIWTLCVRKSGLTFHQGTETADNTSRDLHHSTLCLFVRYQQVPSRGGPPATRVSKSSVPMKESLARVILLREANGATITKPVTHVAVRVDLNSLTAHASGYESIVIKAVSIDREVT